MLQILVSLETIASLRLAYLSEDITASTPSLNSDAQRYAKNSKTMIEIVKSQHRLKEGKQNITRVVNAGIVRNNFFSSVGPYWLPADTTTSTPSSKAPPMASPMQPVTPKRRVCCKQKNSERTRKLVYYNAVWKRANKVCNVL